MDRTRIDRRRRPRVDGCDCDEVGAAHAAAQNVLSGRRVIGFVERAGELAGTHVSALVITFLVVPLLR